MKETVQTRFKLTDDMMNDIVREINQKESPLRMVMLGAPSIMDFSISGINPQKVVGHINSAELSEGKIVVDIDVVNDMPLGQSFSELHDNGKVSLGLALSAVPKGPNSDELEPGASLLYLYYYSNDTKK